MGEKIASHIPEQERVSRIYKDLLQRNNIRQIAPLAIRKGFELVFCQERYANGR